MCDVGLIHFFPFCYLPFQQTAGLRSDQSLDGTDGADLQPDKTVNDGKSFGKKFVSLNVKWAFSQVTNHCMKKMAMMIHSVKRKEKCQ